MVGKGGGMLGWGECEGEIMGDGAFEVGGATWVVDIWNGRKNMLLLRLSSLLDTYKSWRYWPVEQN